MSKIRDMADSDAYPPTCSFTVGGDEPRFTVRILPRAEKATKIPHHLIKVLKTAYKFTIRVRITMEDDNSDVIILKEEKAKSKKAKVVVGLSSLLSIALRYFMAIAHFSET